MNILFSGKCLIFWWRRGWFKPGISEAKKRSAIIKLSVEIRDNDYFGITVLLKRRHNLVWIYLEPSLLLAGVDAESILRRADLLTGTILRILDLKFTIISYWHSRLQPSIQGPDAREVFWALVANVFSCCECLFDLLRMFFLAANVFFLLQMDFSCCKCPFPVANGFFLLQMSVKTARLPYVSVCARRAPNQTLGENSDRKQLSRETRMERCRVLSLGWNPPKCQLNASNQCDDRGWHWSGVEATQLVALALASRSWQQPCVPRCADSSGLIMPITEQLSDAQVFPVGLEVCRGLHWSTTPQIMAPDSWFQCR